jgi:hypothetical protein
MTIRRTLSGYAMLRADRLRPRTSSTMSPAAGWRVSHSTCRYRNRVSAGTSRAGGVSRRSPVTRPAQDARVVRMADRISAAAGLMASVVALFRWILRIVRTTSAPATLLQSEYREGKFSKSFTRQSRHTVHMKPPSRALPGPCPSLPLRALVHDAAWHSPRLTKIPLLRACPRWSAVNSHCIPPVTRGRIHGSLAELKADPQSSRSTALVKGAATSAKCDTEHTRIELAPPSGSGKWAARFCGLTRMKRLADAASRRLRAWTRPRGVHPPTGDDPVAKALSPMPVPVIQWTADLLMPYHLSFAAHGVWRGHGVVIGDGPGARGWRVQCPDGHRPQGRA